jgi:3-oxoacyl-[acyl-carrier-protein] synthase-3
MKHAGIVAISAYLPGGELCEPKRDKLVRYLKENTLLKREYAKQIEMGGRQPGWIETNEQGWVNQPWFEAWLSRVPEKKKKNPFGGTKERRRVPLDPSSVKESVRPHPMLSSDAETFAGAMLLANTGIDRESIDLIMVSSLVPDRPLPHNASLVQHKLQLVNAGAYNIDTCCSSFLTMLELAATLVRAGVKRNVMLVASSLDSIINDKSDYYSPNTGDAAVAAVVSEVDEGYGYLGSHSTSHGDRHPAIVFKKRTPNMFRSPSQGPDFEQEFVTFNNKEKCKAIAVNSQRDVCEVVEEALRRAGMTAKEVDFFISHQPVAWAGPAWRDAVGVPQERFYESFERYGNIACCAAPVNLYEALMKGHIRAGDRVLMASPGVGENHISIVHKTPEALVQSVA